MSQSPSLPGLGITTLENKIALAEKIIKKAYEDNEGKLFISFSGGKDSTILRDIALRLYPELPVVFSNTTNELAEVVKFVKTIPNVITVTPKLNFRQVLEKYGFPLVSKEISQKSDELKRTHGKITRIKRAFGDVKGNGKMSDKWQYLAEEKFDVTHKCCSILKKDPLEKWAKKQGLKPIIALMGDESNLRQQLKLYGEDDGKKVYPFLKTDWEEEDIWAYASMKGIRFAECYYDRIIQVGHVPTIIKARKRTGCEYCGFGVTLEKEDRFARSKLTSPKRFEKMMAIENNGVTFGEALAVVKSNKRHPTLGIPGVKHEKTIIFKKENFNIKMNFATSITVTKKCTRCSSRNLKKAFGHYGNFADSPDPKTGKHRRVFIESKSGYDCIDCGATVVDDLHLIDTELCVTMRLIKYVEKNINKKSFNEMVELTGVDFDKLYNIAIKITREKEAA